MKLNFIEVAGFRGFRDKTRFDLTPAFVVLTGRNGVGKSTLLDAVEFALTGTLSKYSVQSAKGGGLAEHIWWMGDSPATERRVTVGFIGDDGERHQITRGPHTVEPEDAGHIRSWFGLSEQAGNDSIAMLARTSIIRDEHIAAMSLDLPGQARFEAVKDAIGAIIGPDHAPRTESILKDARSLQASASAKQAELQNELGRALTALTDARTEAERSADIAGANRVIDAMVRSPDPGESRIESGRAALASGRARSARLRKAIEEAEGNLADWRAISAPGFADDRDAARVEASRLNTIEASSTATLEAAVRLDAAGRALNAEDTHYAALLDHGSAIGVVDGHCPLCDAARSDDEFQASLSRIRARLADRGAELERLTLGVANARRAVDDVKILSEQARAAALAFDQREARADATKRSVAEAFARDGFEVTVDDPAAARGQLDLADLGLADLENAIFVLEASSAHERVISLERRVTDLRHQIDLAAIDSVASEKGVELARQIDAGAKTIANDILREQFDTVMPLLKELYRRLRPHVDWTEIGSDFGGKVRATLNFTVGEGRNPQFLFSSGQRRAAGLAFLLAIHLSRPWCRWRTLLLDDPVQHIDDYRALNLVEVLSAIRRSDRQTIVAVEDSALADLLCRRLRSSATEPGCRYDLTVTGDGASRIASKMIIAPMRQGVLRVAQTS